MQSFSFRRASVECWKVFYFSQIQKQAAEQAEHPGLLRVSFRRNALPVHVASTPCKSLALPTLFILLQVTNAPVKRQTSVSVSLTNTPAKRRRCCQWLPPSHSEDKRMHFSPVVRMRKTAHTALHPACYILCDDDKYHCCSGFPQPHAEDACQRAWWLALFTIMFPWLLSPAAV